MVGAGVDSPDRWVVALFFLGSGVLIRLRRGEEGWHWCAALGAILGLAYLAKAIMFLLAFAFLLCSFFAMNSRKRAIPRVLLAFLVFLTISAPFFVALSKAKGRLTFGDSGPLAYAWEVKGAGIPYNRLRNLSDEPTCHECSTPLEPP